MCTVQSILETLKSTGNEKTRLTYARHGIPLQSSFGVSVADLKTIAKTIKKQQALAMSLYETGYMDAMYLSGIVADGSQMTRNELQSWADGSSGISMIAEYTVPWVTVESSYARDLAVEWINSEKDHIVASGWCTYAGLVATKADEKLDLAEICELFGTVVREINGASNRARYTMNGFIIAVGTYVKPLLAQAKETASQVGVVYVDVGDTSCKVPLATESIAKAEIAGKVGLKRKTIRC